MTSTTTPGSILPEIVSPDVSNIIFLAGVALCVCGLILMIAAAVLMCKTSKYSKQLQIRERRVDRLTRQYNSSVKANISASTTRRESTTCRSSGGQEVPTSYPGQLASPRTEMDNYRPNEEEAIELTRNVQEFNQPPPSNHTQHMQYMQDDMGEEGWTGEEPSPSACPPPKVTYYASNPVPDPSTTAHYDAFNSLQGYHHPSLYNEMTDAEASQAACTCSPRTPRGQQIRISPNPEYMATSPVPAPRNPPPQFYSDEGQYAPEYDRMSSMTRDLRM